MKLNLLDDLFKKLSLEKETEIRGTVRVKVVIVKKGKS